VVRRLVDVVPVDGAPTAAERAEIRELRGELERVTRERDILGKAVAYFSAAHPRSVLAMVYTFIAEEKANPDCDWSRLLTGPRHPVPQR